MSDDTEQKAQSAAIIMEAANVPISVKLAMQYAGFSLEEIEDRSMQQRVRRTTDKNQKKVPPSIVCFAPSTASSSVSKMSHSQSGSSITSSIPREPVPSIRREPVPSSSILSSSVIDGHRESRSRSKRITEDLLLSSQRLQAEIQTLDSKPPAKKKSRKTSVQRQKTDAEACVMNKNQTAAFKLATAQVASSNRLKKGDPGKKSSRIICEEINAQRKTTVSHQTVRRYVRKGHINVSPQKRGKVGQIPKSDWNSLKDAYSTFIMLEQANKRDQCTPKKLQKLVGLCLWAGGYDLEMEGITGRLRTQTADLISAGKGNPREQRRLVWTTFQNLSTWFDTFHEIVVRLGFARKRSAEDPDGSPEVIFFEGQEERVINFDESPVSIDNTSGERGGRPPTTFYSTSLPAAATAANKTGYTCTVICGSTSKGTPLPPHIQLKTAANQEASETSGIVLGKMI
jgi:DNA-binding transcriptional MerR regulator